MKISTSGQAPGARVGGLKKIRRGLRARPTCECGGNTGRTRDVSLTMTLIKQIRLWPGVVAVALQWLVRFGLPMVAPESTAFAMIGGIVGGGLAVLVWWLFFSRAQWVERLGVIALMVAAMFATRQIIDPSIAGGMMGLMFIFYPIPVLCLGLVAGAAAGRHLADGPRRATLAMSILLACGVFAVIRTEGITGEGGSQLAWRWAKTPEQKLLARSEPLLSAPAAVATPAAPEERHAQPAARRTSLPAARPSATVVTRTGGDWPGFRGAHRDDVVSGVRIKTDWASAPPVELWRRPVGPGWSSFAVRDGMLYTQEQRGESEVVACYRASTGEPVWTHRDPARFWESNGGAGPRSTPTLHEGGVYTFGATGILNALDGADGRVVWTRNAASDNGIKTPEWGFASSPLVVDDAVIVAVSGRLAAYDLQTGDRRWIGAGAHGSYSSPHLATLGGVSQVLLMASDGVTSVAPADGTVLWKHAWPGAAILQPAVTEDGGVLITSGDMTGGMGTRRLAVAHGAGGWTAEEKWTSTGLKPYFNDFVVHKGHAYGFDGGILACIDLQDGKRAWKGGRYGHGQLLLLADQDLLLVLSEEGELALVGAVPEEFKEIARAPAMEGKTWNHLVVAGDLLLVRNDREMVAFRLAAESQ